MDWRETGLVVALLGVGWLQAADRGRELVERQLARLTEVRTLHVEALQGEGGAAIRDLLIAAIQREGLFVLTEDAESADAYLRGSAEDLIYTEYNRYRSGVNLRGAVASSERESGESQSGSSSFGVGDREDFDVRRRRHEALAAVRIALRDGEVVWSASYESPGAKYSGAAADVAQKVAKDLAQALERAGRTSPRPAPPPGTVRPTLDRSSSASR